MGHRIFLLVFLTLMPVRVTASSPELVCYNLWADSRYSHSRNESEVSPFLRFRVCVKSLNDMDTNITLFFRTDKDGEQKYSITFDPRVKQASPVSLVIEVLKTNWAVLQSSPEGCEVTDAHQQDNGQVLIVECRTSSLMEKTGRPVVVKMEETVDGEVVTSAQTAGFITAFNDLSLGNLSPSESSSTAWYFYLCGLILMAFGFAISLMRHAIRELKVEELRGGEMGESFFDARKLLMDVMETEDESRMGLLLFQLIMTWAGTGIAIGLTGSASTFVAVTIGGIFEVYPILLPIPHAYYIADNLAFPIWIMTAVTYPIFFFPYWCFAPREENPEV